MKNCAMGENAKRETELSVANRVLVAFITTVSEDEALAEVATRLKPVLLDSDTINEASLRQAIFGDDS
jgi:hypothetical protein